MQEPRPVSVGKICAALIFAASRNSSHVVAFLITLDSGTDLCRVVSRGEGGGQLVAVGGMLLEDRETGEVCTSEQYSLHWMNQIYRGHLSHCEPYARTRQTATKEHPRWHLPTHTMYRIYQIVQQLLQQIW